MWCGVDAGMFEMRENGKGKHKSWFLFASLQIKGKLGIMKVKSVCLCKKERE